MKRNEMIPKFAHKVNKRGNTNEKRWNEGGGEDYGLILKFILIL
jgi:hypothetical protein